MFCKTCNYWKRNKIFKQYHNKNYTQYARNKNNLCDIKKHPIEEIPSKFGTCSCKKFIYTRAGGCIEEDDIENDDKPDTLLYTDGESYEAYFYTGENFGCIYWTVEYE